MASARTTEVGWRPLAVGALLLVLPLALIGPALLPGRVLLPHLPVALEPLRSEYPEAARAAEERINYSPSDRIFPALSDQIALRRQLASGVLPTWEPDLGLGAPLYAGSMVGTLHPVHAVSLVAPPDKAASWQALASVFLAGLGTWLFLRRTGLGPGACAIGALAVQGGGWGVANLEYFMKYDAALALPWMLWALEGLHRRARGAGLAFALAAASGCVSGFLPIAVFALATAGVYALVRARRGTEAVPFLRGVVLYGALGLGLSAVQLIPTFEASSYSLREDTPASALVGDALPLGTLAGVVFPDAFGAPTQPPGQDPAPWLVTPAERWEAAFHANPLEWTTYVGAACVLLALTGVAAHPRGAALPALLLVLVYGFAQGWPLVRLLYHLPGFDLGAPGRVLAVAWILWPWLAAIGAQSLADGAPRARATLAVGALLLIGTAGIARASIDPATWPEQVESRLAARHELPREEVRAVLAPERTRAAAERLRGSAAATLAAALGAALAAALLSRRRSNAAWAWAPLALVVTLEAWSAGRDHVAARRTLEVDVFPPSKALDAVAEAARDGRVLRVDPALPAGGDILSLARPSLLQPYGIADIATWIVFTPERLAELFRRVDPAALHGRQIAGLSDATRVGHPVFDLLRITAVLSKTPLEHERLELVWSQPGFFVHRRSGAVPPARVVPSAVRAASRDAAFGLVTTGTLDGERIVLEPGAPGATLGSRAGSSYDPGTVTATRPAPNRFDVQVRDSDGGWLVMQEQYFPGWKCTVNGVDADLVCADGAFRAVPIAAGDSLVRTWYEPTSLRLGAMASLLALLALVALALRERAGSSATRPDAVDA